jgi:hypothetical protein
MGKMTPEDVHAAPRFFPENQGNSLQNGAIAGPKKYLDISKILPYLRLTTVSEISYNL